VIVSGAMPTAVFNGHGCGSSGINGRGAGGDPTQLGLSPDELALHLFASHDGCHDPET